MFKAIDPNAVKRYVSPNDPDKGNPTVFFVGVLDPALRDYIDNKCMNVEMSGNDKNASRKFNMNTMQHAMMIVQFGLRGVDNFISTDDKPMAITLGQASINGRSYPSFPTEIITKFGSELIQELAEAILTFQNLSEEERKN